MSTCRFIPEPYQERRTYFAENYDCAFMRDCRAKKPLIIEPEEQICRFCGRKAPDVKFRNKAHAIPELLGNKDIISRSECNTCNQHFGDMLENNLSLFLGPLLTVMGTRGKNKIPKYHHKGLEFKRDSPNYMEIIQTNGEEIPIDSAKKNIVISVAGHGFVPIGVYKSFVKMAISLMPFEISKDFDCIKEWLLEQVHTNPIGAGAHCYYVFLPGNNLFPRVNPFVLIRKNDMLDVPYCQFVVQFNNLMFQIFIPSFSRDSHLIGKEIPRPPLFPIIYEREQAAWDAYKEKIGNPDFYIYDLSGTEKTSESLKIGYHFEQIEENPIP